MLEDIAILTGGTVIGSDVGLSLDKATLNELGSAKKVEVTKKAQLSSTVPVRKIRSKLELNRFASRLKKPPAITIAKNFRERVAMLAGGVALIKVGAATEVEMKEKKARVEDALHAHVLLLKEGVVAGGGVALIRAKQGYQKILRVTILNKTLVLRSSCAPWKSQCARSFQAMLVMSQAL